MAQLPEERQGPPKAPDFDIPRVVTAGKKSVAETMGGARVSAEGVSFYSNANRQLRYQYLPDRDPNETDEQIEAKLNERFAILEDITNECIEGRIRAAIASGPGGVGKTFIIDRVLARWDPDNEKHTSASGYSTPVGLFRMLYTNRKPGSLVKMDDLDSVFNDEKALNFLKIACDTTQKRIITNASEAIFIDDDTLEQIPRSFEFEGSLIWSTNLDFDVLIDKGNRLSPHLEALITRSHYIDLAMRTKRDYLMRVFMVADPGKDSEETPLFENLPGGLDEPGKNDVLDFMEENYKILRECSLRMALKLGSLRQGARDDDAINWKRKALLTCCRNVR
jgi:hypothetical protein